MDDTEGLSSSDRSSDILSFMDSHSGQYHAVVFESNGSYVGREVPRVMCFGATAGMDYGGWTMVSALMATTLSLKLSLVTEALRTSLCIEERKTLE